MKDEDKTKDELINQLVEMRQRIAELEANDDKLYLYQRTYLRCCG